MQKLINSGQTKSKKKSKEAVGIGCFDRRKDGMLLTLDEERTSFDRRRLEHRIIVGGAGGGGGGGGLGFQERWSDVQPSDLLYLRSEMIMSDSRGLLVVSGSRPSLGDINRSRSLINGRSVSEITGLSRLSNNYAGNNNQDRRWEERGGGDRAAEVVSRWLAWVSQARGTQETLPAVGS